AQHDLAVFLRGAGDVLDGVSPYAYRADSTFAYPPFAAWLFVPLHPLSSSAAAFVWTLLSLAMVGVALWLLELRDWRCYALVGVFLCTRSAIDLGTIEPLLLLAVAAAWHWRDRAASSGVAAGLAIVLKLFLWPLAVWLALARPRLSWLWFVPLAYYPLGEAAWPAGDARKLGLALVASLVVLLAGVVRTQTLRTLRA